MIAHYCDFEYVYILFEYKQLEETASQKRANDDANGRLISHFIKQPQLCSAIRLFVFIVLSDVIFLLSLIP